MKASKEDKLDKRAAALRDNLKRRKVKKKSEKEGSTIIKQDQKNRHCEEG